MAYIYMLHYTCASSSCHIQEHLIFLDNGWNIRGSFTYTARPLLLAYVEVNTRQSTVHDASWIKGSDELSTEIALVEMGPWTSKLIWTAGGLRDEELNRNSGKGDAGDSAVWPAGQFHLNWSETMHPFWNLSACWICRLNLPALAYS